MKVKIKATLIAFTSVITIFNALSQDMSSSTRVSQRASITQRIGSTDITIVYHSPTAKGRKIFGGIVPYDFVVDGKEYAWRAGSNQRTTIEFAHDVTIEGKHLKAGSYGFVVLVSKKKWTLVFSSGKTWGAFQYTPENDVLRVDVPVERKPHQEWLSYNFINRQGTSVDVELRWEKVAVKFNISTDVTKNLIADLTSKEDKNANEYRTLASTILQQDSTKLTEALQWVEKSLEAAKGMEDEVRRQGQTFASTMLKADILIAQGKEEGKRLWETTINNAQGFNIYYYGLSPILLRGDKVTSYKLLSDYVRKKPTDWVAHLALGEYYLKVGNQKKVVEHFQKAAKYARESSKNYATYLYLQNKLVLEN